MNFSVPIPRAKQPLFHEGSALRSVRDSDANSKQWTKNADTTANGNALMNAVTKINRDLTTLRRRKLGYQTSIVPGFPFQIYQPTNVSAFTSGITFLDSSSGTPTACNIDSTKPTDFTATPPTVNPVTDAWRFWAVRSGMVEIREIYTLPPYGTVNGSSPVGIRFANPSNSDGYVPAAGHSYLEPVGATLVQPIILSQPVNVIFTFWIKIVQDTSTIARASASVVSGWRAFDPAHSVVFNSNSGALGPYVISIGELLPTFGPGLPPSMSLPLVIAQELSGHAIGRYPTRTGGPLPSISNIQGYGVMNHRGFWNADADTTVPADLKSQIFYPGDTVTVKATTAGVTNHTLYQKCDDSAAVWHNVQSATSEWVIVTGTNAP